MRSTHPIRLGSLLTGSLVSVGLVLLLAAPSSALRAGAAPGTEDITRALLDANDPELIDWRVLAGLDYRTGEWTPELDALNGQLVKMIGFPVPFEDYASNVREFLLVPYEGACVHVPAPPPHQVVWVQMRAGSRGKLLGANPVWVEGTLHIEMGDNVYGQAGFRLSGITVTPVRGGLFSLRHHGD